MLIRINLLPVRQVKKREMGRQLLVLFIAVLVLGLVGNYVWYDLRDGDRERKAKGVAATQQRINELQKVIGEVNNINKRKKEVEDKLKVLNDLRARRSGPVRMMDALATATPKKVWLRDFTEVNNAVSLRGNGMSHDDIAEFMRGLASVVWTPRGLGRQVEQKRDAKTVRVELMGGDGAIDEFQLPDVKRFFTNIELRSATQQASKIAGLHQVDFEIALTANYAI